MTISFVDGDILDGDWDILVQSVNHQGIMGAGLAKQIATRWPEIVSGYKDFCNKFTFEDIRRNGFYYFFILPNNRVVMSIFGQEKFGRDRRYTDYASIATSLTEIAWWANRMNFGRIAIPYGIGCGLGGGDWAVVFPIVQDAFAYYPNLDVKIYKYNGIK